MSKTKPQGSGSHASRAHRNPGTWVWEKVDKEGKTRSKLRHDGTGPSRAVERVGRISYLITPLRGKENPRRVHINDLKPHYNPYDY
jgi:hypothetical protein